MVDRKDIVLLEAGGAKGTEFLIAPSMLVTALQLGNLDTCYHNLGDIPGLAYPSRARHGPTQPVTHMGASSSDLA